MEERQTFLAFIWKIWKTLWEWEVEEQNLQGVSVVSGPLLCPQGVGEPETQRAVWALTEAAVLWLALCQNVQRNENKPIPLTSSLISASWPLSTGHPQTLLSKAYSVLFFTYK